MYVKKVVEDYLLYFCIMIMSFPTITIAITLLACREWSESLVSRKPFAESLIIFAIALIIVNMSKAIT